MARFLFVTQTFPRFAEDTAGPFIRELARALVRGGDAVTVLAPHDRGLAGHWVDDGVQVQTFRYAPAAWEVLGYGRSLVADERPRAGAALVAPLYLLGAAAAVRRTLRYQPAQLVHLHWIVPNGVVAALPAVMAATPVAIGLHGSDVFLAERRLLRFAVRRALARSRLLTGCSPELVERVARFAPASLDAEVIPYGVDPLAFSPDPERRMPWRQKLGIGPQDVLVLGVGRMATKKGFQVLVEGLPRLLESRPRVHVVLAGGGDLEPRLRADTERWRGRVHFPGSVARDALPDLYRAADVFVMPAVHDGRGNVDGLPNVVLEAMATALPVVATNVSGIPLAVRHAQEGLLVDEGNAPALADATASLCADPAERRRLGLAARRRVETGLTWDAIAARYRRAYARAAPLAPLSAA